MTLFVWMLAALGALVFLAAGLVSAAAFSDAWFRCPGAQCGDAMTSGTAAAIIAVVALAATLTALRRLRRGKTG